MSESIMVALITGIFAIIGNLIISRKNTDELYIKLDKQSELADQKIHGEIDVIKAQIAQLTKEVEKHNAVIERTQKLETSSLVHEQELKTQGREIEEIKEKLKILERK